MSRIKRGTIHTKRRRRILRQTKGFFHRRKSHLREARQALFKAGQYAYRDRRKKKTAFRGLWQVQINAALRPLGLSYGTFMHALRQKNVTVNRKVLAELAREFPEAFRMIVRFSRESSRKP